MSKRLISSVDRLARYKVYEPIHTSRRRPTPPLAHITGSQIFLEHRHGKTHFSARTRIVERVVVEVGIDAVLTAPGRSLKGDARRRLRTMIQLGHPAGPHSTGCRLDENSETRSCSRLCSVSIRTLTVARRRSFRVRLSRSDVKRTKRSSRSVFSDSHPGGSRSSVAPAGWPCRIMDLSLLRASPFEEGPGAVNTASMPTSTTACSTIRVRAEK